MQSSQGTPFDRLAGREPAQLRCQAMVALLRSAPLLGSLLLSSLGGTGCSVFDPYGDDIHVSRYSEEVDDPELTKWIEKKTRRALGFGPNRQIAEELFAQAEQAYSQGDFTKAAAGFAGAAKRWPDSALEEDALFLYAESLFFSNKYTQAYEAYQELLAAHENTRHLATVSAHLFLIAEYWERIARESKWPIPNLADQKYPAVDTRGNALAVYRTIRLNDPTGPLADDTLMKTAGLMFEDGKYNEAEHYYELLRREYPRSEHQAKAHLLAVQAKWLAYQGHFYEASGLDGAEKLSRSTARQFRTELPPQEIKQLRSLQDDIRSARAERDLQWAVYYENGGHYRAARFYYFTVLENYYDLPEKVHMAREGLKRLKPLPDQRAEPLDWIGVPFQWLDRKRFPKPKDEYFRDGRGSSGIASSSNPSPGSSPTTAQAGQSGTDRQ